MSGVVWKEDDIKSGWLGVMIADDKGVEELLVGLWKEAAQV